MSENKPKITVYGTSWCGFCHAETAWFKSQDIPHEYKDIEADPAAQQELLAKMNGQFQGVPVTTIGDDIILGFDRPNLMDSLRNYGFIK